MSRLLLALSFSLIGFAAHADQCAYITLAQAKKAVRVLLSAERVQSFCEPCGETTPETLSVQSLGLRKVDYENYWEVQINESGIDLAYTYVNGKNLAMKAGCEARNVSEQIDE